MALGIAFLASLLGFPAGIIVAFIAPEELKKGMKYFKVMSIVLGLGLVASLAYAVLYREYVFLLSSLFLLGVPLGSIAAYRFLKMGPKGRLRLAIK
ncbi:hypothetical protein HYV81_06030 [Candidatus Woesearchaeota archaeon]|nr:hypothetical protein [Candidatus Woesearchaeota archaeon]